MTSGTSAWASIAPQAVTIMTVIATRCGPAQRRSRSNEADELVWDGPAAPASVSAGAVTLPHGTCRRRQRANGFRTADDHPVID
jgi:hypothetical protein